MPGASVASSILNTLAEAFADDPIAVATLFLIPLSVLSASALESKLLP
jgi:hypothetical protein